MGRKVKTMHQITEKYPRIWNTGLELSIMGDRLGEILRDKDIQLVLSGDVSKSLENAMSSIETALHLLDQQLSRHEPITEASLDRKSKEPRWLTHEKRVAWRDEMCGNIWGLCKIPEIPNIPIKE